MVIVFIMKQIIKLHHDYYTHRAFSTLQIGENRAKLPWVIAVLHFAFTISLTIGRTLLSRNGVSGPTVIRLCRHNACEHGV
jgi:hypothetical protein